MAARWPTHGREIHGARGTLVAANTGYDLWQVTSGRVLDLRTLTVKHATSGRHIQVDVYDSKSGGSGLSGVELSGFLKLRVDAWEPWSGAAWCERTLNQNDLYGVTFLSSIHVIGDTSGIFINVGFEEY
jgi:hypothetical protein